MENNYINVVKRIHNIVQNKFHEESELDDNKALSIIANTTFEYFESYSDEMIASYSDIEEIVYKIFYKTRSRLNILKPLIDDEQVSEIMVNNYNRIFFEKNGEIYSYNLHFDNEEEVEEVLQSIAGQVNREINELNPILDARLPDGSRVNGVFRNIAVTGPSITIRKFSKDVMSMEDLINNGTITVEGALLLKTFVKCGYNIFVSGATSSGKTTLINSLGDYIESNERVIVIEDSAELKLNNVPNLVQMECRNSNSTGKGQVTISDLIKNCLRMRPDRIIIGEVRAGEVFDLLQAMNTGHSSMSTGHGNSIEGMLKRLETMYLMSATIDTDAIRRQIAEGIDVMVHIERRGNDRRIVEITEVVGYEDKTFILNPIMKTDTNNNLRFTGSKILNSNKIRRKGKASIDELHGIGVELG